MSYSFLDHVADVRMRVESDTLEGLFTDAVKGMMDLLEPEILENKVERQITLEANDTTALLIDFLSEVLLNVHIHKEAYSRIEFKYLKDTSLEVNLYGSSTSSFGEDIKAVTYHEADVHKTEEGKWKTNIIFDI